jgi:hypothetical protein
MNENLSARSKWPRICKQWTLGATILVATAALAWWLVVGMGLPYVAWCLAATVVGLVLYRLSRVNGYGIALWLVAEILSITLRWMWQDAWFNGLMLLCAFALLVLLLISCVIFLVTAFQDQARRGRHCAACIIVLSSLIIPGSYVSKTAMHARDLEEFEHTTETLITLHRLAAEIETIRAHSGRLPTGEELETLRGAPLPVFWKDYRIQYERHDEEHYELSCTMQSFWGYGWDIWGWIVCYHGRDAPRRIQVILF